MRPRKADCEPSILRLNNLSVFYVALDILYKFYVDTLYDLLPLLAKCVILWHCSRPMMELDM